MPTQGAPRGGDPYAGIENETVYGHGARITAGQHIFAVHRIDSRPSEDKSGVTVFTCEMDVVKSRGGRPLTAKVVLNPQGLQMPTPMSEPLPVGLRCSVVYTTENRMFLKNVKSLLKAVTGRDDIDGAVVRYAAQPQQPFNGARIYCDAKVIETKEEKKDFTLTDWCPESQAPAFDVDTLPQLPQLPQVPTQGAPQLPQLPQVPTQGYPQQGGMMPPQAPAQGYPQPWQSPGYGAPQGYPQQGGMVPAQGFPQQGGMMPAQGFPQQGGGAHPGMPNPYGA